MFIERIHRFNSTKDVIEWYETRINYYKENIGNSSTFGPIITQNLIDTLTRRITQLKKRKL